MKLFDTPRAPNPRRVRIFMAEKGLHIPIVSIDLGKMEHKSDDYTTINPAQTTPALLLDDGTLITESVAICRYLEELHPQPPLFGTGAKERALVEMWQRKVEFGLFQMVAYTFRHSHPAMANREVPQIGQLAETSHAKALNFLKILDEKLGNTAFVAGNHFSIADITALVAVDFMKPAKIVMPDGLKHLGAWLEKIRARPGTVL